MALQHFPAYIDGTLYQAVLLDPTKALLGQRYDLPKQDNVEAAEFEGKKLIVDKIERGVGSSSTVLYHLRTE